MYLVGNRSLREWTRRWVVGLLSHDCLTSELENVPRHSSSSAVAVIRLLSSDYSLAAMTLPFEKEDLPMLSRLKLSPVPPLPPESIRGRVQNNAQADQ